MLESILSVVGLVVLYFVLEYIGEAAFEFLDALPFVRSLRFYVSGHTWPTVVAWMGYALLVRFTWPALATSSVAVFLLILGGLVPVFLTMLRVRGRRIDPDSVWTVPNKR